MWCVVVFFFVKQKTAYEMRISDWSSDVCSSDLAVRRPGGRPIASLGLGEILFLSSRYGIDPNIAPQASIGCVGAGPGLIADVRIVDHAYSCWITHHARQALSVRRENGRTCRLDLECLYSHQVRASGWLRRVRRKRRACNHQRYRKRVLTERDHHLLSSEEVCAPQMRGHRLLSGSRSSEGGRVGD